MVTAHDENGNNVNVEDAKNNCSYFCPICGGKLIIKQGEIRNWHFAHASGECEDTWNYDMSEWHLAWQEKFPKEFREITITHNGEKHRADILVGKTVVEFQHSPMSCGEFRERNRFYTRAGYKVVWVFDFQDAFYEGKIKINPRYDDDNKWLWNWAHATFDGFYPQYQKDVSLYFQLEHDNFGETIVHVIWFPDDSNKYFQTDSKDFRYVEDIEYAISNYELRKETGYCIYDLYDEVITSKCGSYGDIDAEVFNCPKGKAIIENCVFCSHSVSSHYRGYGCTQKFSSILKGWNNETDRVLNIEKDEYGIVRKTVAFKNGKQETFSYPSPKVGYTLFELVYNTDARCIIVENVRTRNQFKIGTRYYQRNRNAQIEGYFRKDSSFDFPEAIPANRKPIWYANRPEWMIIWNNYMEK